MQQIQPTKEGGSQPIPFMRGSFAPVYNKRTVVLDTPASTPSIEMIKN